MGGGVGIPWQNSYFGVGLPKFSEDLGEGIKERLEGAVGVRSWDGETKFEAVILCRAAV